MKKIFLTSGIIVCMACPAFATGYGFSGTSVSDDGNGGYTANTSNNTSPEVAIADISGETIGGACVQPILGAYSGAVTLTAKWIADSGLSLIYAEGSHGTSSVSNMPTSPVTDLTHGNPFTIATGPSATGYTFTGWSSNWNLETDTNTTTPYSYTGTPITYGMTSGHTPTLTAQWTAHSYTVTYDCNSSVGGDGTPATGGGTLHYDDNATAFTWASNTDASQCYKNGYHFTGWTCSVPAADTTNNTAVDVLTNGGITADNTAGSSYSCGVSSGHRTCSGSGVTNWAPFATVSNGATITCYAQYAANTITLNWDDGDNNNSTNLVTVTTDNQSCQYSGGIELPANPTRSGYTFNGWDVSATEDTTLQRE